MIDLDRFDNDISITVPIIEGVYTFNGRRVKAYTGRNSGAKKSETDILGESNARDGWFIVSHGTTPTINRRATLIDIKTILSKKQAQYVLFIGSDAIPLRSNNKLPNGKFRVHFCPSVIPLFSTGKVVEWEDGNYVFYEFVRTQEEPVIQRVKECFDEEKNLLGVRGVTPEIRYYYLLADLQKQGIRAIEELKKLNFRKEERERWEQEYAKTFAGTLFQAIQNAGGELVRFTKLNETQYNVHWRVGGQDIKSIIQDDLRVISAGYCLSNDDKNHTMHSLINLAKLFQEEEPLYITRE